MSLTQMAGMFIGSNAEQKQPKKTSGALVHILDKQTDEIIGTLSSKKAEFWDAIRTDSLNNLNVFDFVANAKIAQAALLEKRNRVVTQDEDGHFREYIITYAEQYKRGEKLVKSNASFTDLAKAKVIEPQTLQGSTSSTAASFALDGTEWQPGDIDFTFIRTINIKDYTDPYNLLELIASTFGLELSFRIVVEGNRVVGRYVDLKKANTEYDGTEIEFGKDLIGVKRKEDSQRIVTALLGVGPEREDGTRLTVFVEDKDALQRWGRKGQHLIEVYEPESTDEDMTEERLRTLTENELEKRIDAITSYECEAVSLEHINGFEHKKIRKGMTVRIKDDGYQPPLYLEARIQDVEVDQITHQIKNFKIGNFIEYSKTELEKQIANLKVLMSQRLANTKEYIEEYAEKKKVLSLTPPADTSVMWVKPDTSMNVNIAHIYDSGEWVPITTTNASDIVAGEMLFDRLRGGVLIAGGKRDGIVEVKDASNVTHTKIDKNGVDTNKITIRRPDDYTLINNGQANWDFAIDAHEPPFMEGGVEVYSTLYRTKNYHWTACNFYSYRHSARYLKIDLAVGVETGGVGWIRVMDRDGTTKLWELSHAHEIGANGGLYNYGREYRATIDLGVPTGNLRSFYIQLSTGDPAKWSYVRVIRKWLEG